MKGRSTKSKIWSGIVYRAPGTSEPVLAVRLIHRTGKVALCKLTDFCPRRNNRALEAVVPPLLQPVPPPPDPMEPLDFYPSWDLGECEDSLASFSKDWDTAYGEGMEFSLEEDKDFCCGEGMTVSNGEGMNVSCGEGMNVSCGEGMTVSCGEGMTVSNGEGPCPK